MDVEFGPDADFAQIVTDQMHDGAIVVNTDLEIVYLNQPLTEIMPDPSAVMGANAITALEAITTDSDSIEQYETALEAVLAGADVQSLTVPVSLPSQEMILHLRITPYRRDGTCVGAVIIARDVTEREQLKDHLLYLNQLLRHDIRNDLSVIEGYAELIAADLPDPHEELDAIISASQHGMELTQTARDFIRHITEEGPAPDRTPIEIVQVIRSEIEQVRLIYPEADIMLAGDPSGVSIQANELLRSVVRNLLANAVQHNPSPEPTVEVGLEESPEYVELRVADDGPGIPDAQKSAIFDQDEKGPESSGSGIGLYLVEQVVQGYGGDVWITDNDPTGAVFHIKIPK